MTKHTTSEEQQLLDDLDKKLWNAADKAVANPLHNIREGSDGRLVGKPRWQFGVTSIWEN